MLMPFADAFIAAMFSMLLPCRFDAFIFDAAISLLTLFMPAA